VVLVLLAALPLAVWWKGRDRRSLLAGLLCGCGVCVALLAPYQWAVSRPTGAHNHLRHYDGFFLLAPVSPLVSPQDSADPRVRAVILERGPGIAPLDFQSRFSQLWEPEGLAFRMRDAFGGDEFAANRAAKGLALAALWRDPLGCLKLMARNAFEYARDLRRVRELTRKEMGATPGQVFPMEVTWFHEAFHLEAKELYRNLTPSRAYLLGAAHWYGVLFLAPLISALAFKATGWSRFAGLLFLRDCILFAAICFGAVETIFRYFHPFSFSVLASFALLAQAGTTKYRAAQRGRAALVLSA
jgi:hypothetical protein